MDRSASHRAVHNYTGNDPAVLKLLDTVYVDTFPVDSLDFGPLIQPAKRGAILSRNQAVSNRLWRPQGQLVAVLGEHSDKVTRVCVAPDHTFFLTGSEDGSVKVWDSARLERNVTHRSRQTYQLAPGARVTSLCFVSSTHTFIATGSDGSIHVVKVEVAESGTAAIRYGKLRTIRQWTIPNSTSTTEYALWSVHYRADSASTLIISTNLNRILSVDIRSMSIIYELHNPPQHGTPTCFCLGRKSDWLLVGTSNGVLDLWDLRFRLRLRSWAFPHAVPITRLQTHPSRRSSRRNRVVVSGGTMKGEVTVWDIEKVICHEIYRPALENPDDIAHVKERDYTLRNLDDDRPEGLLNRVKGTITAENRPSEQAAATQPALSTAIYIGQQQISEDAETQHEFIVSGSADGRVRFWDCDRLDGCRLVSGGGGGAALDEKPEYHFSPLVHNSKDTRVLTEVLPRRDAAQESDAGSTKGDKSAASSPTKRSSGSTRSGGSSAGSRLPRYETIRSSAQRLQAGHLDMVTDVAVLERPFGMVISTDRSGQVFVFQ